MIPRWTMKILLPLLLAWSANAAAQAGGFQRLVGGPALDRGVDVRPVPGGGYVGVGVTRNTAGGDEDVLLVRTDAAGQILWQRHHGGNGDDDGWAVHPVAGGFAVAGFTSSGSAGGYDFYLLLTDHDGTERWSRTYGGSADDRCWSLLPLPDGGFVLAGETLDTESGEADFLVVRTDAAGATVWSRTYGGAAGDRCFSVAPAGDGGLVLVGQTYSEGAGDRDAYVVRTDALGTLLWSRTVGGPLKDVGHDVDPTGDGGFLVTGYTLSFAADATDPYLIKLDPRGEVLWTRVLNLPGEVRAITAAPAARGGFFVTGFRHDPRTGSGAAILIRTDAEGHLAWTREFFPTRGGQSFGYGVNATPDGGCVITGHTTEDAAGDLDLFIVNAADEAQ